MAPIEARPNSPRQHSLDLPPADGGDASIDVMRSMDFTVPGIIAHESAMSEGDWRDVPVFGCWPEPLWAAWLSAQEGIADGTDK